MIQLNPNLFVSRCAPCGGFHDRRLACRTRQPRRLPEVPYCPDPEFDLGLCRQCGRTTVDHLVERANVASVNGLRAGASGTFTLTPIYKARS